MCQSIGQKEAHTSFSSSNRMKSISGMEPTFIRRLYTMLDDATAKGFDDIVSWSENGTAFRVHFPDKFTKRLLPEYFNQTKYKSFQRQLNMYGFYRFTAGSLKGACSHSLFVRGSPDCCEAITRAKTKRGTKRTSKKTTERKNLGSETNIAVDRCDSLPMLRHYSSFSQLEPSCGPTSTNNAISQIKLTNGHPGGDDQHSNNANMVVMSKPTAVLLPRTATEKCPHGSLGSGLEAAAIESASNNCTLQCSEDEMTWWNLEPMAHPSGSLSPQFSLVDDDQSNHLEPWEAYLGGSGADAAAGPAIPFVAAELVHVFDSDT